MVAELSQSHHASNKGVNGRFLTPASDDKTCHLPFYSE
jgi:hypothetical protein